MLEFNAMLIRPAGVGTWTYLNVPVHVDEVFGTKNQVKVKGTLNDIPFQGTLMPHGDGSHFLVVNKEIRDAARVTTGDTVHCTIEQDFGARAVLAPDDFLQSLMQHESANLFYEELAYSYQKEYVAWIDSAKRPETRTRRIQQAVEKLSRAEKLKS
ncbi:hypothetical protein BVG16_17195 [Paenibacillus selenitireducens]|uniref:Antitermination protein NusB n=1 Tax=Paenibacillus selenitireducens TaxID=1324314 RepID=A0A1T2XAM4_9BACL|nr:YdeI/OmpD-associated family protein [Paenibacillus selenitireducens]OPA76885.1 hypothetical protein BVG16_17195 [Paenibacillus selenitireducens]